MAGAGLGAWQEFSVHPKQATSGFENITPGGEWRREQQVWGLGRRGNQEGVGRGPLGLHRRAKGELLKLLLLIRLAQGGGT